MAQSGVPTARNRFCSGKNANKGGLHVLGVHACFAQWLLLASVWSQHLHSYVLMTIESVFIIKQHCSSAAYRHVRPLTFVIWRYLFLCHITFVVTRFDCKWWKVERLLWKWPFFRCSHCVVYGALQQPDVLICFVHRVFSLFIMLVFFLLCYMWGHFILWRELPWSLKPTLLMRFVIFLNPSHWGSFTIIISGDFMALKSLQH